MLSIMSGNPAMQQAQSMYSNMGNGGGMGIGQGLQQNHIGGPAASQIKLAMQDMGRINAHQGMTGYNLARGQMDYDLQNKALAAQRQLQLSQSQQGTSLLMQMLQPFLGSLMNQS